MGSFAFSFREDWLKESYAVQSLAKKVKILEKVFSIISSTYEY